MLFVAGLFLLMSARDFSSGLAGIGVGLLLISVIIPVVWLIARRG
jgi:hypothetical protein